MQFIVIRPASGRSTVFARRVRESDKLGGIAMLVKEYMTKDPVTCSPDEDVRVAFGKLTDMRIRQAPVLEEGKLVGIVTDRDLRLAVVETVSGQGLNVRSVMTAKPVTISEDAELRDAAKLLGRNKFNALPVISAGGELTGVLTTTDVLNGLVKALDAEKV